VKIDLRVAFATLALVAVAACSGMSGLDSGAGGMGGEVAPPVNGQGALGSQMGGNGNAGGPTAGPNGMAELTNPGSTLAPNQAQYPVADGPTGMKCPTITIQGQQYLCNFSFNIPGTPNPNATPAPKKATATPSPTPEASASADDDNNDASDTPTPSPTPPGGITLQVEALPTDVPGMTNPDMRALKTTPVVGIRLQSDTDFVLDGTSIAAYTLPKAQMAGRQFALQLYNETFPRTVKGAKRTDLFIAGYARSVIDNDNSTVTFTFAVPKITVKRGQIWLIVLYGLTYPPNSTPTPSPSPASSASSSASPGASASASPSGSPAASPTPKST
jgi:hypothetical protein